MALLQATRANTTTTASESEPFSVPALVTIPLVPYDVQHRRLLRRLRRRLVLDSSTKNESSSTTTTTTITTSPLYIGYGTHYVDLWCGRPTPQRQTVIVDTGSDATAFPCSGGCEQHCGVPNHHVSATVYQTHWSEAFRTITSCSECLKGSCRKSSFRRNRNRSHTAPACHVEMHYREGSSWTAHEVQDVCYMGGYHDTNVLPVAPNTSSSSHSDATNTASRRPTTGTSTTARKATANAVVDGLHPAHASHNEFMLQFACQTKVSGAFRTQLADGILGLQPGAPSSLATQIGRQQQLVPGWSFDAEAAQNDPSRATAFALCFAPATLPNRTLGRKGISAGLLTLGGVDPRLNAPGTHMVYSRHGTGKPVSLRQHTQMKKRERRWFGVELRHLYLVPNAPTPDANSTPVILPRTAIRVNVSDADLNHYQAIVDSGSTDTYLTSKAEAPFQEVWKALVGRDFDAESFWESRSGLPTIIFQLKGLKGPNWRILQQEEDDGQRTTSSLLVGSTTNQNADGSWIVTDPDHPTDVLVALEPHHYTEPSGRRGRLWPHFRFDAGLDSTLGASALLGYHVLLDEPANRLGWARSSCNYSEIVQHEVLKQPPDSSIVETRNDARVNGSIRTPPQAQAAAVRVGPDRVVSCAGLPLCHLQSWMVAESLTALALVAILTTLWKVRRRIRPGRRLVSS